MYHFDLYEDEEVSRFGTWDRHKIINIAVKMARQEHPVNKTKVIALALLVCITPSIALYFWGGIQWLIAWFGLSTFCLNYWLAKQESPLVKAYLAKAVGQFDSSL
ncbi:hypothetical protein [uncultured Pseudoteredinibacter sp.]|uniref:hypothetical protein n=1 Tax=uncultured Pseudoteredinibacter sp. TaxID=1641701 RepID=UPI00260DBC74|nr:hypothetical protein [uncultured Pseudoteredinibacter sp.]